MKQTCLKILNLCLSFLGFLRPVGGFLSFLPVMRVTSISVSSPTVISVMTSDMASSTSVSAVVAAAEALSCSIAML